MVRMAYCLLRNTYHPSSTKHCPGQLGQHWNLSSRALGMSEWCTCSCCSVADGGRLLQATKTRRRHVEADQRNQDRLAMLEARRLGDKHQRGTFTASSDTSLPAQPSSPLSSTHDRPALPQAEAAMVLPAPASIPWFGALRQSSAMQYSHW